MKLEDAIAERDAAQRALSDRIRANIELEVRLRNDREHQRRLQAELDVAQRKVAALTPVDRTQQLLASGRAVPGDRSHTELKENGQQQDYVVLSPEERAKGFVRPYRDAYVHLGRPCCGKVDMQGESRLLCLKRPNHEGACTDNPTYWHQVSAGDDLERIRKHSRFGGCGQTTTMSRSISETYARDPYFYSGTFCCTCGVHRPLDQFVWAGSNEQVGS